MSKTQRRTQADWIQAGFLALAEHGPQALRAETLARRIGTSKGSFYWHFADVPAFHAALLSSWEKRAFTDIVEHLKHEPCARTRLRKLGTIVAAKPRAAFGGVYIEPAIRAWARADAAVAAATLRIDQQCMDYLRALLKEIGHPPDPWSRLIYSALIGLEDLSTRDNIESGPALTQMIELLLAQS